MKNEITSPDGTSIHFEVFGNSDLSLVFVHGWLGSGRWWSSQSDFFSKKYQVVTIDLAGHGKSGRERRDWSGKRFAEDIATVVRHLGLVSTVLIGHSMAGAYVLESALLLQNVKSIILIDTLKNLDQQMTFEQAEERLLVHYRKNFRDAVENMLPKFLFCESTPPAVRRRLQNEFLNHNQDFAATVMGALYSMDIKELAKKIDIPVRAINSTFTPTSRENNQKYFRDYNFVEISNTGHYPMLERPTEFNKLLEKVLAESGMR